MPPANPHCTCVHSRNPSTASRDTLVDPKTRLENELGGSGLSKLGRWYEYSIRGCCTLAVQLRVWSSLSPGVTCRRWRSVAFTVPTWSFSAPSTSSSLRYILGILLSSSAARLSTDLILAYLTLIKPPSDFVVNDVAQTQKLTTNFQ